MKKLLLLFVFAFSTFTFAQDKFTRIDSLLNYLNENNKFMGSLTIREGENVVFNKAYGFADVEKNIKADRFTRYKIGSISKTFTAVMVMQLIEEKTGADFEDEIKIKKEGEVIRRWILYFEHYWTYLKFKLCLIKEENEQNPRPKKFWLRKIV